MGEPDGGLDLVDVLATLAAGAVGVHLQVGFLDLDFDIVIGHGSDIDGGKGGVALLGRIKRRDTDEAMDAALGLEVAVGVLAGDFEGGGLGSHFFPLHVVDEIDFVAAALCPALVHPEHHVGPVTGFGATGAGVDVQVGVASIKLAGE